MQNMLAPLKVFGIYLDHIKDILIVVQIVSLSGGIYLVGQKWHEFSSVVSINGLVIVFGYYFIFLFIFRSYFCLLHQSWDQLFWVVFDWQLMHQI